MSARLELVDLKGWITKSTKLPVADDFVETLYTGILLCQVLNSFLPPQKQVVIKTDALSNPSSAISNLENFLQAAALFGVDEKHLFSLDTIHGNDSPDEATIGAIVITLKAIQSIVMQVGSPEEQNKWTKNAAETRREQNIVARSFARKEDKGLSDVTSAVRDFKGRSANDNDLRYQKQGQQKWNMFETNYQREKGITVEQSLQEIDEFSQGGKFPEMTEKQRMAQESRKQFGGQFKSVLNTTIEDGKEKHGLASSTEEQDTNELSNGKSGGITRGQVTNGGKPELLVKPKMGGAGGAAFFSKYAEGEKRKYKPGNENAEKKLW